jgi:hypothetical protein
MKKIKISAVRPFFIYLRGVCQQGSRDLVPLMTALNACLAFLPSSSIWSPP